MPHLALLQLNISSLKLLHHCLGSAYNTTPNRLTLLQKRAIRTNDNSHYRSHSKTTIYKLNILKLNYIYLFSCCMFIYKFKNKMLPNVCECLFMLNINYKSNTYY